MISVAMATYNGEKYIKQQIDSILKQSIQIDELIIVDDASVDLTISIIESYNDNRIQLYKNKKNQGYIDSFFEAVQKTQGDIIFLSDQDDIWEYQKVEIMLSVLKKNNCEAVCSACSIIDSKGDVVEKIHKLDYFRRKVTINNLEKITFERLLFQNVAQGCTYCFKKIIKQYYIEIHEKKIIHDYQIMLISSLIGTVYYINKPLIKYRIHEQNALAFNINIKLSRPSIKPKVLCFISKINKVSRIRWEKKIYAYIICYLRLPFFKAVFLKIFGDKKCLKNQ